MEPPDWLWNPEDTWSIWKGVGRIGIFLGLVSLVADLIRKDRIEKIASRKTGLFGLTITLVGVLMYGVGLLGLRMTIEQKRETDG